MTSPMIQRTLLLCAVVSLATSGNAQGDPVVWHLDNLTSIAGHPVTVVGNPKVIDTPNGKAIEFDGVDDGIFLDVHPLAGMPTFTVEVIFKPYENGPAEQRFFHMQENQSEDRVMFETRLVEKGRWFVDTFIKSGDQEIALYASDHRHQVGTWQHTAIAVDENSFTHFVNGQKELSEVIQFAAPQSGRTSLGMRINKVYWFKGAIRTVRLTPKALTPEEFLTAED